MDLVKIAATLLSMNVFLVLLAAPAPPDPIEKIRVVVTAPALRGLVEAVGGDLVVVESVIPPGVDPHEYEPGIDDVLRTISNASLIVMTGPHHFPIEERIRRLAEEGFVKARVVDYEDYLEMGLTILRIPGTGVENPHGYFYSISGLRAIAKACARELSRISPDHSDEFEKNLERYLKRLGGIEDGVRRAGAAGMAVILGGPMLQYLAEDLGLEVVDVIVPAHGVEPSLGDLEEAVRLVKGGKASLVILSDQEAAEAPSIPRTLGQNGIPYLVIPVTELSDEPELIPLVVASLLKSGAAGSAAISPSPRSLADALLIPSLAANLILIFIIVLLLVKVRRYGGR